MILYWLWRLGVTLTQKTPIWLSYPVASALADVAWLFMPVQRRNTIENMVRVTGDVRLAPRVARRSFENYACYIVDFMRQAALSDEYLFSRTEVPEWSRLVETLAPGKGCILVLTHFGNWDFGAATITLRGYPFSAIAEAIGDARISAEIFSARSARGLKLIPMARAATGIIRSLRRNEFLAILIDRPLSEGGVEVKFFGATTRVPEGPARLALRTGAKLVPVGLLRVSPRDDRILAVLDFSVEPPATGDREADVRLLTQALMASHERIIRRYPDQWYMFRRMWPSAPRR
jgi:lauroyl/myristoyl acyltransferase